MQDCREESSVFSIQLWLVVKFDNHHVGGFCLRGVTLHTVIGAVICDSADWVAIAPIYLDSNL